MSRATVTHRIVVSPITRKVCHHHSSRSALAPDTPIPISSSGPSVTRQKIAAPPNEAAMRAFCERFPGVVVIDEAYAAFAEEDCLELALSLPNVVVCRTMSKAWSLAGIRLGYMIGPRDLIESLFKIKDSYNVNALTQAAALAALDDPDWMRRNRDRIVATRAEARARHGWIMDIYLLRRDFA